MYPKDGFFADMARLRLALAFKEVRLKTSYTEVQPADVSIMSRFSRRVQLKIPILSAAMDTVTGTRMAIAMAKLGGLGIIHRNLGPKEQAAKVARTKLFMNGLIEKPIWVRDTDTIEVIDKRRAENRWSFYSFPVLDANHRLIGLLTQNDFTFGADSCLTARDIMTTDVITAKTETTFDQAYDIMHRAKKKVLPLVDDENKLTGLYVFSDVTRLKTGSSTNYNLDPKGQLRVGAAIGLYDDALQRLEALAEKGVDVVVIDQAHGDSKVMQETLALIRKDSRFNDIDVVAGNISQGISAKHLVDWGADGVKVGQGPGSICTTRVVAGIGCPQVTAVYQCALAIRGSDVPVCADGGIVFTGDIPIALATGAHSVMLGRVLAGTTEAPGEVMTFRGTQVKAYRGMGSLGAMEASKSSRERYAESSAVRNQLIPEGVEGVVPYDGDLEPVLHQFIGGLRKGMWYAGAATLDELHKKADFDRNTNAGFEESRPHDIIITKDAPNYKGGA